jgi:hypothetical protein
VWALLNPGLWLRMRRMGHMGLVCQIPLVPFVCGGERLRRGEMLICFTAIPLPSSHARP